jgi:signal transduction histidine kinase
MSELADAASGVPPGAVLAHLDAYAAWALAFGLVNLVVATLLWLCSRHTDTRALRIFAARYLLAALGWVFAHPRAHGGADDVPLLPAVVGVVLVGMTVWGLHEYLEIGRRRFGVAALGTAVAAAALLGWLHLHPDSALALYGVITAGFAYCSLLAWRAARREDNVGHRWIAFAFATNPLLFIACVLWPEPLAGFELAYYFALPTFIAGVTLLAVSLIRARQRAEAEIARRIVAERALRELNATLETRVELRTHELRAVIEELDSFNRTVSHDLRGPLAGLSGLAQLAQTALDGDEPRKASKFMHTLHLQIERMTTLVHDLLTLSRVADEPVRRGPHPLRPCVDEALDFLRMCPDMRAALTQVHVEVEPLPEAEVDPTLMRQVFVNLLGNAAKFTAARGRGGHVRVGVCERPEGRAVCVEDDGLGLPVGREHELFKPFGRLHGNAVPGSGVGLTIVKRIVENHGGQVWAEHREGGGARFLFTLGEAGGGPAH